jgi:hypothetical protein
MSTNKPSKKKVVVTTGRKTEADDKRRKAPVRSTRSGRKTVESPSQEMLFGKKHYILMGIGAGLILIGLLLMSGGSMPSPDVWDEGIIYGFRRTVLAPFFILAGLSLEIYAIFYQTGETDSGTEGES